MIVNFELKRIVKKTVGIFEVITPEAGTAQPV
jgi:hypothetical protein